MDPGNVGYAVESYTKNVSKCFLGGKRQKKKKKKEKVKRVWNFLDIASSVLGLQAWAIACYDEGSELFKFS